MIKPDEVFELSEDAVPTEGERFLDVICGKYPSLENPKFGGVRALEEFITASGLDFRPVLELRGTHPEVKDLRCLRPWSAGNTSREFIFVHEASSSEGPPNRQPPTPSKSRAGPTLWLSRASPPTVMVGESADLLLLAELLLFLRRRVGAACTIVGKVSRTLAGAVIGCEPNV